MKGGSMKKSCILFLFLCCIFCYSFTSVNAHVDGEKEIFQFSLGDSFVDDEIIVVLKNEESLLCKEYDVYDFSEINPLSVVDFSKGYNEKIKLQLNNKMVKNKLDLDNFNRILKIKLPIKSKLNVYESVLKLEKRDEIKLVKPSFYTDIILTGDNYPNDTNYADQWYIQNANIDYVWENYTTGSNDVTVGIIDSGISNVNKDIKDKINEELSCSFVPGDFNPLNDSIGHGTAIAGVIGAAANNDLLIAGVCPNVQLVSLKIANSNESINFTPRIIEAIEYAGAWDIDILNISWGCTGSLELLEAIENFPGLIICSAGNRNIELTSSEHNYPASYTTEVNNIISVGGYDENNNRYTVPEDGEGSNYSRFGYVDIYAPGIHINSVGRGEKEYSTGWRGTSFAAAIVTGVVALMYSYHPNIYYTDVKNTILNNTDLVEIPNLSETNKRKLNAKKVFDNFHSLEYSCITYNNDYHKIC